MALYKQDDILTLDVVSYGMDGEGIAKQDGFVFFVKGALAGETVKAKVLHVNKKNLVFCDLKEVIVPSKKREKPVCNRFERCGGCDMLHISYDEQLRIKRENVKALFRKNMKREDIEVDDVVPCSTRYGYRNKIQLPFGTVNGKVAMGFFRENSHRIVSVTKCFLHGEWAEKLIDVMLRFANENGLTAYDDATGKGLLKHAVARKTDDGLCIVVVTSGKRLPFEKKLIALLEKAFGDEYALYNSIKKERNNVVLGEEMICLKQKRLTVNVLGIKAEINPYSFLQLNNEIRDKIYGRIVEEIKKTGKKSVVVDAYAGVGTLGAILAKDGNKVLNVEIVKEATEDGKKLAKENGLTEEEITNINGDAAVVVPKIVNELTEEEKKNVVILLDPPRKGCDERVLSALSSITAPHTIYYISCNPATLTRDLNALLQNGYQINYVTPYDMFPNTKHVETLVQLSHKTPDSHIVVKVDFDKDNSIQTDTLLKNVQTYKPAERVTYKMIQAYVEEKYGYKVHTSYIAEVKRCLGLPMYDAPNAVEELKRPRQHPSEKMVEAIKDALNHFGII